MWFQIFLPKKSDMILQACTFLISQEVHYNMRYRCALIAVTMHY